MEITENSNYRDPSLPRIYRRFRLPSRHCQPIPSLVVGHSFVASPFADPCCLVDGQATRTLSISSIVSSIRPFPGLWVSVYSMGGHWTNSITLQRIFGFVYLSLDQRLQSLNVRQTRCKRRVGRNSCNIAIIIQSVVVVRKR